MGKLDQRLASFDAALKTLEEVITKPSSDIIRDATIQRFEYTMETAWKTLKHFLADHEGIECDTPKGCVRQAFKAKLLDEQETEMCLQMVNDRNLTSHTYIEEIARKIATAVPEYAKLLRKIVNRIKKQLTVSDKQ